MAPTILPWQLASLFLAIALSSSRGPTVAMGAGDSLCGDISGAWTSGWPAADNGGSPAGATPPPGLRWMTVRRAVTPFGKPHAQYVVDYNAALALHPDGRTGTWAPRGSAWAAPSLSRG